VQGEVGDELVRMSHAEVRRHCAAYADKYAKVQSEQFQRLGVMGEFGRPYITMSPEYEAAVLEVFARMLEQGLVYRQLRPVHWSIENRTALAEAELEYHDREDDSIYVLLASAFAKASGFAKATPDKSADKSADKGALKRVFGLEEDAAAAYLMIWTTTPWTLPANLAVAVHPEFEYSAVKFRHRGREVIAVIAAELVEASLRAGGGEGWEVLAAARGAALADAGVSYLHPLVEGKVCPVVPANYVTLEDGTGLVHTAPGHGLEDYGTALKCGLEVYCPVQADGTFDETAPAWLVGKTVWEANPLVVEHLEEAGTLFHHAKVSHSYPHDWRSKTPTIFRATEQWFVGVDRSLGKGGTLWCVTRERWWGLPIPAFYGDGGRVLMTPASVRAVAKHFAKHGSDSWFTQTPAALLGEYDPDKDPDLGGEQALDLSEFQAGTDILDVWFESGSSWFAGAMQRGLVKKLPVDLYLEGSDQHRGWFQLSLLPALSVAGVPPFKTVVTHGFVVTEEGFKMSKSLGNAIDVIEQLSKRGADVLRLWVASQNYQDDVRCSEKLIAQAEDAYRKIRNTLRFCMGACFDFDPAADAAQPPEHSLDRWMRLALHELIRDVLEAYEKYEFHKASRLIYEFCTVQASSIYMAAVKDRLYCELPDSPRRRATQTVLHEVLVALIKLVAPILPHTAEEAWQHIPGRDSDELDTPHLALMPEVDTEVLEVAESVSCGWCDNMRFEVDTVSPSPVMVWQRLLDLRQEGLIKLEALRTGLPAAGAQPGGQDAGVKNPLDAEAVFAIRADDKGAARFLKMYLGELEDLLGVGYARIETAETLEGDAPIAVRVADARGKYKRCARSWKRRPDVGSDPDYPDLSARDAAVIKGLPRA
ncbi:MAG: hypothetical protein AMJ81_11810, partial [Phycisphaerae bacterium SM23_33]